MSKYVKWAICISAFLLSALSHNLGETSSADACAGSTYGPGYIELASFELYGVTEGFLVQLNTNVENTSEPSTLDDLIAYEITVDVTPVDQPEMVLRGQLSVPEHDPREGFFLWTPDEGSLALGSYRVMLNTQGYFDGQESPLTVGQAEMLASSEVLLSMPTLEEVERGVVRSCCRNLDFEACSDFAIEECVDPEEHCREICWASARRYAYQLSAELSWPASEALTSMSHVKLVSNIGEVSLSILSIQPTLYKRLAEGELLPDQACLHLLVTHMITGERLETPEICIPSSSFMHMTHVPFGVEDYEEYELNEWLSCDELNEFQRSILISVGKLPADGERAPAPDAEQTPAASDTEQAISNSQGASDEESCQQKSDTQSWALVILALFGALLRRRLLAAQRVRE